MIDPDVYIEKRIKIQPNELRLGNWVYMPGPKMTRGYYHAEQVKNWAPQSVAQWEPIPIRPEWLVAMGFEKQKETCYIMRICETLGVVVDYGIVYLLAVGALYDLYEIKYVHQLQNLIFVLTGEEIKIKQ